jgi:hypothetical protein
VQHIDKPILTAAKETWHHQTKEDTSVKVAIALAVLFFSFGAVAEEQDASTIAACDVEDFSDVNAELNTISVQIIATQPATENLGEVVDEVEVATTGPSESEDVPVEAILRNREAQTASEKRVTAIIEQSTPPTQTIPDQPTLESFDDLIEEPNGIASAGSDKVEDVPDWGIAPNNELQSPIQSVEGTVEPQTILAQVVAAQPEKLDLPLAINDDCEDW